MRTPINLHTPHTQEIIAELREKLAAENARADVTEREREHMQSTIDDLRARLDRSEERITALLAAATRKKKWWWL